MMTYPPERGVFREGNIKQKFLRFTWELPQTIVGLSYTNIRFATDYIDHVGYYDGATFVYSYSPNSGFGGVTMGSIINIDSHRKWPRNEKRKFDPTQSMLFMHEYGHYLQSQEYGWGYLFSVGIPSLLSSKIDNDWHALIEDHLHVDEVFSIDKHLTRWFEVNANQKAEKYFRKKGIPWKYEEYPVNIDRIIGYYYKNNN